MSHPLSPVEEKAKSEEAFLIEFLHESTHKLERIEISEPHSLEAIRALLLEVQTECLEAAVFRHNSRIQNGCNRESSSPAQPLSLEQAQSQLRRASNLTTNNLAARVAMQEMNGAARLAFCRLALYSECVLEVSGDGDKCKSCPRHESRGTASNDSCFRGRPVPLQRTGRMERDDVLEFIGLCDAAVRLDVVQRYLSAGNSSAPGGRLFSDLPLPESSSPLAGSILPQDRLEYVQRLLLQAIGYDPVHGHSEIRRIFFEGGSNEFSHDAELLDRFVAMSTRMDAALTQATLRATLEAFNGDGAPHIAASMDGSSRDGDDNVLADEGATSTIAPSSKLHQEILGELMMMDEDERMVRLEEAQVAETERTAGDGDHVSQTMIPEVDEKTHRLLLTGRIWNAILDQNGGQPPKFE